MERHVDLANKNSKYYAATDQPTSPARQQIFLIVLLIFSTALAVRLLNWYAGRTEAAKVQTSVALNYKHLAQLIRDHGLASLYDGSSPTSNPDLLGHPPGYSIILSLIYAVAPYSDTATQLTQIVFDSIAAVIICLITFQLFPVRIGIVAGFLAVLAPQFSWNAITLLPDSLAALPILLAIYLITLSITTPSGKRLLFIFGAGALIGLSCWLRANALLLAPFITLLFPIIFPRGQRWSAAVVLVGAALLFVSPLTLRNAVVFGRFIPVSLGAGQTLIEGIADYNPDGSFGLPQTDLELTREEAQTYNRPDYVNSLFTPDGVSRERARLARGLTVIRSHPFWFAGVMVRRAFSMLRLERTPLRLHSDSSPSGLAPLQASLRALQKLFITAIVLPLVLFGAAILVARAQYRELCILLVVPFYYFVFQSALHTEYRYVLVIHYFLFLMAALSIHTFVTALRRALPAKPSSA
jgi:4-amino-4-deoxy-L-arabinose transferase-like glycosyltransferase